MMSLRVNIRHYRTALRRWHRSKGHGIHSPFAFRFVRDVLRPRRLFGYYGEEAITARRRALRHSGVRHLTSVSLLRRVVRVTSSLAPVRVVIAGDDRDGLFAAAARCATSSPVLRYGEAALQAGDMLIVTAGCDTDVDTAAVAAALDTEGAVYLTDIRNGDGRRLMQGLTRQMAHTQTFTNDREAVMVSRHDFTAQLFYIWF